MTNVSNLDSELFWIEMAPYLYDLSTLEKTIIEVETIISHLHLAQSASILDMACGSGRHVLEFARKGFPVVACDINLDMTKENQKIAKQEGLKVEWVHANMLHFRRANAFDAIINLFYSFGFFEERDKDQIVIDNFYHSLNSGGSLVMQMMGRDILEKWFYPKSWNQESDGAFILNERQFIPESGWLHENFYIVKKDSVKNFQTGFRVYYAHEIVELLHKSGFRDFEIYGSFDKQPYNEGASCLLVIAKKPQKLDRMIRC